MNYDLEAQEGKIYPHSRAIYLFDSRLMSSLRQPLTVGHKGQCQWNNNYSSLKMTHESRGEGSPYTSEL
jgi:hypothetical protein